MSRDGVKSRRQKIQFDIIPSKPEELEAVNYTRVNQIVSVTYTMNPVNLLSRFVPFIRNFA
jgi:hypothetical protein